MLTSIPLTKSPFLNDLDHGVVFVVQPDEISLLPLNEEEKTFLKTRLFDTENESVSWVNEKSQSLFLASKPHRDEHYLLEHARKAGAKAWEQVRDWELLRIAHFGTSSKLFQAF